MIRLLRLTISVSLCGLFTSAAILACHHRQEPPATAQLAPATPPPAEQPAPTTPPPGQQPGPTTLPPGDLPTNPTLPPGGPSTAMPDAGVNGLPPPPGAPHATLEHSLNVAGVPPVVLASQPTTPQGPTGAPPTPGAPTPNPPTPSPNAPSPSPTPNPPPGTPPSPGMPPSPTGPSQPGGPTPPPGAPQTPSPGTPAQTPRDAGVGDALTPPVPPISDGGIRIDSGMSPILRRDAR